MSMADRDGVIWSDGKVIPWRDATTHVLTHTLHYGLGVFEGLRAYQTSRGPAIFRLKEHTDRLFNSAHIFMMRMPFDKATLMQAQCDMVRLNNLESCYIRPIVFYGSEAMGISAKTLSVHVAIAAWPWGAYLGSEGLEKGIRVKTSSFSRHHVNVNMCRAKSVTTYANSILAHQEVAHDGYDEALLLDVDGYVAEGAGENVFIIKHGKLYTPDMTSCLEGITRASIIELAGEIGVPVIESVSLVTRFTVLTRPFLQVPPPRSLPFASSTTEGSEVVSGARSPRGCKPCFSTALTARPRNMRPG